ncbi:MAG: Crossover junction endodeoxyribonuclease RuvC [Alphaproteobacteria bacterium MarineAlpha11_Bin1]|nr:MAG: Crossover junction endodeoxyribonuclease RuvC [Alphaproteobacteria bacterium MarineAlpha11_Bin1]|tara:strand:+ start:9162 stop:9677 length:516 start_codon:yes stop_codon:yes gene_type:complete
MAIRLIGLDPGLRCTGWGIIEVDGSSLKHVASGEIKSTASLPLSDRLSQLFESITGVLNLHSPDEAAIEETFVNKNPSSTLKLGHARGAVMLAPARLGISVSEYSANLIKKSLVGNGHADKNQVQAMVCVLLPGAKPKTADAADALAIAICHAHHRQLPTISGAALNKARA